MARKVFLYSPYMDKGYSLQIFHNLTHEKYAESMSIYDLMGMARELGKKYDARIFFQGNSVGWLMIEFWTDNQDAILDFCMEFAERVSAELMLVNDQEVTLEIIKEQLNEQWL
jgi:hypothetical protein